MIAYLVTEGMITVGAVKGIIVGAGKIDVVAGEHAVNRLTRNTSNIMDFLLLKFMSCPCLLTGYAEVSRAAKVWGLAGWQLLYIIIAQTMEYL